MAIKTRAVLFSKVEAAIRALPPLRTSGDRRCPDHPWLARLPGLDRCGNPLGVALRQRRRRAGADAGAAGVAPPQAYRGSRPSCCRRSRRSAFRRARSTPTRVEARFDVADGYYLYRDKLRFAAAPGGPALGRVRVAGRASASDDEFFGEVEIYRGTLIVEVAVAEGAAGQADESCRGLAGLRRRRRLLSADTAAGAPRPAAAGAGPGPVVEAAPARKGLFN